MIRSGVLLQGGHDYRTDQGSQDQGNTDEDDPFAWLRGSHSQPLAPPPPPPAGQLQAPQLPAAILQQRQEQRQQELLVAARAAAADLSRPLPHSSTWVRCCSLAC